MAGIDQYTKLMLHNDGVDGSISHPITFHAGAKLSTATKKFGVSSFVTNEQAASSYASLPAHSCFNFGTNDFTIDTWIRFHPASYGGVITFLSPDGGGGAWNLCQIADDAASGYMRFTWIVNDSTIFNLVSSVALTENTWQHLAVVRNGTSIKMYVDGTESASGTTSESIPNYTTGVYINRALNATSPRYGISDLDELRVSNGIARWTSNFTPPTSKYVSDQYTALLLHFDGSNNATATEDSSGGDEAGGDRVEKITTYVGTAQLDTAQSKFGGSSLLLDGNSDYVTISDSDDWNFGTGNFTWEAWVYFNSFNATYNTIINQGESDGLPEIHFFYHQNSPGPGLFFWVYDNSSELFRIYTSGALSTSTWYHLAVVRSGTGTGDTNLYINGIKQSVSTSGAWNYNIVDVSEPLTIGRRTTYYTSGYFDEIRISKGIARWTADFTPPTEAYAEIADITVEPNTLTSSIVPVTSPASPWVQIVQLPATFNNEIKIEALRVITSKPVAASELTLTLKDTSVSTVHFPGRQDLTLGLLPPRSNALVLPEIIDISVDLLAPGVGTSAWVTNVELTAAAQDVIINIKAQPRSIAGPFQLGVYAGFNPKVGSLAPRIVRYIYDPVVTSGCPQCGTLLFAGNSLTSSAIPFGENRDLGTWRDSMYVRCARCGFVTNLDRHNLSQPGSRQGWGTRLDEIRAGGDA